MKRKDVIVIGGGAAGSSAAYYLAKAGNSVIVVEKNASQSLKPCGGGMASVVQEWFPFDISSAVDQVIRRVDFSWFLSDKIRADLPGGSPFWIVRREILDKLIIDEAIKEGAELIAPFNVKNLQKESKLWQVISNDGEILEAKAIVIADGSNSPWPKKFGLGPKQTHQAFTTSVRLKGKGNLETSTARFEFGLVKHGFAWAFPIQDGVNVGVGTFIGKNASDSEKILEEFLPSLGFDPLSGIRQEALLRVWDGHYRLNGEGILAIGDAASLCDPFLAEGLRPAIMSGIEAAAAINLWLQGEKENLNSYTTIMKKRWGNSMAWGKRISQVFYRFPKIGYQLGIKRPTAPKRIAQILSGEMGYEDIATRVIKRLLLKRN